MPAAPVPKIGGRPTGFRRAPLVSRQPACKPGSVWHASRARTRDGHSSGTPVARRLKQPTRTAGSGHRPRSLLAKAPRRPYSVLLPVGFAVPPTLPPARCALTAPFHPCRPFRFFPRKRGESRAGWPLSAFTGERGKSGLHGGTVPGNARRGRPQGKCHRERTALLRSSELRRARVKRCGKSAPRFRQRKRHGKPHQEQDRIGTAQHERAFG